MPFPVVAWCAPAALALVATAILTPGVARADVTITDRTLSQPLVLDQNQDYFLHKVQISGVTDFAALTLAGRINSVNLSRCVFSNVWSGVSGKAVAAEAQGAVVGSFTAVDTAFEDAQHQLLCLREGAFGTVTLQRCKFRTSDSFLKKIYSHDPWRARPPTTEFANIDRLELLDNEYTNTILVVHPSVKLVIFRGDLSNVRLESKDTHVIRLEKNQDPASIGLDGTAIAMAPPERMAGELEDQDGDVVGEPDVPELPSAEAARDSGDDASQPVPADANTDALSQAAPAPADSDAHGETFTTLRP